MKKRITMNSSSNKPCTINECKEYLELLNKVTLPYSIATLNNQFKKCFECKKKNTSVMAHLVVTQLNDLSISITIDDILSDLP